MCAQAQCTSLTGAHEHAGTLCPTSLAQTEAEGLPGGGDNLFCLILWFISYIYCILLMSFFLLSSLFILY